MIDDPVTEYYIRSEDIRGEITLKRYKDRDYFMYFGIGLVITGLLCIIPGISNILFIIGFLICLVGTGIFFLFIVLSGDSYYPFWDTDKILVTTTGIALRDYEGRIRYLMPFSKVTSIRYGYSENIVSAALDLNARVPIFLQFNLIDGKKFTIPINYIVEKDRKKIFAYLPL